jgi:GntR family transcriptional regulator/MocR family aminotransferase
MAFELAGAKVRGLPVDEQGVVVPAKPIHAKLIYTTPSRQFPTGACLPVARRMALLEFAKHARAWIVEDDYDSEFRYSRPPLPSLHSLAAQGRVINVGSMSKVLFPGLRIGYLVLPPELVQPLETLRIAVDDHGILIDQATLAEFIEAGAFDAHIRRCRKVYADRLANFLECAERQRLPLSFPFTDGGMNQAGFLLESAASMKDLSERVAAGNFDIPAIRQYMLPGTKPRQDGLVFGFTAFDKATTSSALKDLAGK